MEHPVAPAELALRYVTRFACTASACHDNCCAGLRIEMSAANHARLVAMAAGSPLERQVGELVKLLPTGSRAHAAIAAGDPWCPFLAADKLCGVQRELGEAALPDPCSLFPRVVVEVGGRRELSATLACPEAARLCLTGEAAVELVPYPLDHAMARPIVVRTHDGAAADPYVALVPDILRTCRTVMSAEGVSVHVRILLLVDFAARIEPFFHAGTTSFELDALRAAIDQIPARASAMTTLYATTALADMRAVHAAQDMLIARLIHCDHPRFNALVRSLVLADPDADPAAIARYFEAASATSVRQGTLASHTLDAYVSLRPELHAQLDEYTRRYALNSLVKDWYTARPTLASWLRQLVVRLALSRLLTLLHPRLAAIADDDPESAQLLETAALDAFQLIAKTFEHDPEFMSLCERYVIERGLTGASGAARLLRI